MAEFISSLLDERTWVRVAMIIVGSVLIFMSLVRTDPAAQFANALRSVVRR